MNREDLARFVVRAYPAGARQAGNAEMTSTLLDAGDASATAFSRELVSVVFGGFVRRTVQAQRVRPLRLLANALVYGGLTLCVWMTPHMSYWVAAPTLHHWKAAGFYATAFLYGLGFRRTAGVVGIAALVTLRLAGSFSSLDYLWAGCQTASFLAMAFMPPARRSWQLRVAGLGMAVAALAVASLFGMLPTGWYLMAAVGLVALPLNPALTLGIGGLLAATGLGFEAQYFPLSTEVILLLLGAPVAVSLVLAGQRVAVRANAPLS